MHCAKTNSSVKGSLFSAVAIVVLTLLMTGTAYAEEVISIGSDLSETTTLDGVLIDQISMADETYEFGEASELSDEMNQDIASPTGQNLMDEDVDGLQSEDQALVDFAKRLYSDVLGREPDSTGLKHQIDALVEGQLPAEIAYNFFDSEEYRLKDETAEQTVERMYHVMFGRDSDESGLEYWVKYLETGMSVRAVAQGFSESEEYRKYFASLSLNNKPIARSTLEYRDQSIGITGFVQRLYNQVLEREPDIAGLNWQTRAIINGFSCMDIATNFFTSEELELKDYSFEKIITIAYSAILGRSQNQIDGDEQGFAYWLSLMEHGGLTYAGIASGFCQSLEFTAICNAYGMNPGSLSDAYRRVDLTGRKVTFIGDSITFGSSDLNGGHYENRYPTVFGSVLGGTIVNLAIGGNSFADMPNSTGLIVDQATRIDSDTDVVFMMCGTNDHGLNSKIGTLNPDENSMLGGLARTMEAIRSAAPNAIVVCIIPPAMPGDSYGNALGLNALQYKEALRGAYKSYGVMVCDFTNVPFSWKPFSGDYTRLLPNEEGHRLFGEYLANWYNRAI